jgi:hypothetical protein
MSVVRTAILLAFGAVVFCFADGRPLAAQEAADRVKTLIEDLNTLEKTFQNYAADIVLEDRLIELKGRVEFLKGSFIFVGEYRNRASALAPTTDWAPIEFGVFGNDSQAYYPESRHCGIHKDDRQQVPGQFPMNPALLFSQKHSSLGLSKLLQMPGEASFSKLQAPDRVTVVLRFLSLIENAGDRAIVHEIEFTKDTSGNLVENSLRGGGRGNFRDFLTWKQTTDGLWYPHEQNFYEWPRGETKADTTGKPPIYCRLDSLTTRLRDFQYMPCTVESRLPFGAKIERYPSKFEKQSNGRIVTSYSGGSEGELQHKLDLLIKGFKATLGAGGQ